MLVNPHPLPSVELQKSYYKLGHVAHVCIL
jgi:hypothetical protein